MRRRLVDLALLAALLVVVGAGLVIGRAASAEGGEAFVGTDAVASDVISAGGHQPWFAPLFQPSSGEVESGLFAVQAALGGGLFGYCVGRLHARRRQEAAITRPVDRAAPPDQGVRSNNGQVAGG